MNAISQNSFINCSLNVHLQCIICTRKSFFFYGIFYELNFHLDKNEGDTHPSDLPPPQGDTHPSDFPTPPSLPAYHQAETVSRRHFLQSQYGNTRIRGAVFNSVSHHLPLIAAQFNLVERQWKLNDQHEPLLKDSCQENALQMNLYYL